MKTGIEINGINQQYRNKPLHFWAIDFQQECLDTSLGRESLFNKQCQHKWITILQKKRMKLDPYLTPPTKINNPNAVGGKEMKG